MAGLWSGRGAVRRHILELSIDVFRHDDRVRLVAFDFGETGLEIAWILLSEHAGWIELEGYPLEELGHFDAEFFILEIGELLLYDVGLLLFR